ncbi:hypothetical protein PL2TA16_04503, partial [Pseudoalteromonas luteoviolacea 2ta16]
MQQCCQAEGATGLSKCFDSALLNINADAVKFMNKIRDEKKAAKSTILIGGMVGCKNDCYRPQEA